MNLRRSGAISVIVLALTVTGVAGCSSSKSSSGSTGGGSSATSTPDVTIDLTVTGNSVSPPDAVHDVKLGQHVRITVHVDTAQQIHLHGYDVEKDATPSQPVVFDFTANIPGVVELESHKTGQQLMQLEAK